MRPAAYVLYSMFQIGSIFHDCILKQYEEICFQFIRVCIEKIKYINTKKYEIYIKL